jgi:hypothetical protein
MGVVIGTDCIGSYKSRPYNHNNDASPPNDM